MTAQVLFTDILHYIRHHQDGDVVEKMNKSGIQYNMNYGLSYHLLNQKAKSIGRNHELAVMLWKENIRECRLLYMMLEDAALLSEEDADVIVRTFTNHEIAEIAAMHLFVNYKDAIRLVARWIGNNNEYVKLTGFALLGRLSLVRKDMPDNDFITFIRESMQLPPIGNLFVKRNICFALTAIAKRGLKKEIEEFLSRIKDTKTELSEFVCKNVKEELEYL